jgi:hypothetical protein
MSKLKLRFEVDLSMSQRIAANCLGAFISKLRFGNASLRGYSVSWWTESNSKRSRRTASTLARTKTFDHCSAMSTDTVRLLEEFEKLPLNAQKEFSDVILRRAAQFDYDAPSDEELTLAAREVFAMLDREEDADAKTR